MTTFGFDAHAKHAYFIAIFFAKEGHGPGGYRVFRAHHGHTNITILPNEPVYLVLDQLMLFRRERLWMAEVKAQALRCDKRAFLCHMRAQMLTQGCMQQVCCRVIGANLRAPLMING